MIANLTIARQEVSAETNTSGAFVYPPHNEEEW